MSRTFSEPEPSHRSFSFQENVGVLLWGPPGCGKSSSAQMHMHLHSPMYFINTDSIVESMINNFFDNEFFYVKNSDPQTKQTFYWNVRLCTFGHILSEHNVSDKDIINTIFSEVFSMVELPTPYEITRFQVSKAITNITNVKINDYIGDLAIFLAKHRGHSFMIETTGGSFDADWASSVFGDIKSVLQIVFVSSPETLINRVQKRTNQLVNATPDRIISTYNLSYYDKFADALNSNIFDDIIVDINDNVAMTVLHVEKIKAKSFKRQRFPYTITKAAIHKSHHRVHPPTAQELEFIHRLFSNTNIPSELIDIGREVHRTACSFYNLFY